MIDSTLIQVAYNFLSEFYQAKGAGKETRLERDAAEIIRRQQARIAELEQQVSHEPRAAVDVVTHEQAKEAVETMDYLGNPDGIDANNECRKTLERYIRQQFSTVEVKP